MMCSRPYVKTPTGVKAIHFLNEKARLAATPFGCGQCLQCRINKAREWKHRLILEGASHKESVFTTLTYSDHFLPDGGNLKLTDFQKFLKRLRKNTGEKFRYYGVGEYGAKNGHYKDSKGRKRQSTERPHYHAMLFGVGQEIADEIQKAWAQGRTETEPICSGRTGYIVGYTTEKLSKDKYAKHNNKTAQFATMSRSSVCPKGGGIGIKKAVEVAEQLRDDPRFEKRIITSFGYGKKSMPLGRYLAQKVNEVLGIPEDEFEALLLERQFNLFKEHVFNQGDDTRIYYDKLLEAESQKRKNREARFKNWKRRKRL
jgi:hypothetical protein